MKKIRMTTFGRGGIGSGMKAVLTVFAILGLAAAVTMFGPSGKTVNAASEGTPAKPAPTPLRADAAAALLQQLKDSLADNLEEDVINEIQAKWDRQILTGKTREQILKLLFDQLKTVVEDEETQNTIWESWQSIGADEEPHGDGPTEGPTEGPTTPTTNPEAADNEVLFSPLTARRALNANSPEAGISNEDKRKQGAWESMTFEAIINQTLRWSQPAQTNYKGQSYTIYKDLDDPEADIKVRGVNQGVKILVDRGVALPANLTFYIAKDQNGADGPASVCKDAANQPIRIIWPDGKPGPKCKPVPMAQAFKRDRNWAPIANIVISSTREMNQDAMSKRKINGLAKIPVTTIHEISHILHERYAGEFFWTLDSKKTPRTKNVSSYGSQRLVEYVAEFFTGAILGVKFDQGALIEYRELRGPRLPQ